MQVFAIPKYTLRARKSTSMHCTVNVNGGSIAGWASIIRGNASVVATVRRHGRVDGQYTRSLAQFGCGNTHMRRQSGAMKIPTYFQRSVAFRHVTVQLNTLSGVYFFLEVKRDDVRQDWTSWRCLKYHEYSALITMKLHTYFICRNNFVLKISVVLLVLKQVQRRLFEHS